MNVGQETVLAVAAGGYEVEGTWVDLRNAVDDAVAGTVLLPDGALLDASGPFAHAGRVSLTAETTAAAAARLSGLGAVTLLNFASAKNPGGGFLGNAKAQEEDLARASALYACQCAHPRFYSINRGLKSAKRADALLYSDAMLWSPNVPFFRDDSHLWLATPFLANVITAPAPNAGEFLRRAEHPGAEASLRVREALHRRAGKLLALAAQNAPGCRLVLGAWGCGVFRNDPTMVAEAFAAHLPSFARAFEEVVFAVWSNKPNGPNYQAFESVLTPFL